MTKLSAPGHPFQYAWHVPDLDKAIDYWANVVGVGPFFINEVDSNTMEGFQYRGAGGNLQMRIAWAQGKEGQIELIEVTSKDPNVYHDLIDPGKSALHHIGIWSDDYQKDKSLLKAFLLGVIIWIPFSKIVVYWDDISVLAVQSIITGYD